MILAIALIVIGAVLLFWSADKFVDSSAELALALNVAPVAIGIFVMGFATSAPELLTSVSAAIGNIPKLAIGNAYGSNIANIGLCIGLTALIKPIQFYRHTLKVELPFLIIISVLTIFFSWNLYLGRFEGGCLMILFLVYLWLRYKQIKADKNKNELEELKHYDQHHSLPKIILILTLSFIVLLVSAQGLIWGAEKLARMLGVSEAIIGLTIIALGTSLPEFASTISAVKRDKFDLAMGNIVGSNIFNTLVAVGIVCLIRPLSIEKMILYRDISFMFVLTMVLVCMCYSKKAIATIGRIKGGILLVAYLGYVSYMLSLLF